jgi:hypothetical protein
MDTRVLDNGQHILLGAYKHTLALMRDLRLEPERLFKRQRLDLRDHKDQGFRLQGHPSLNPLVQFFLGAVLARGWSLWDRVSLLKTASNWYASEFKCSSNLNVQELCRGLSTRVMSTLITPLCISAFNTPPELSSASVFLRVMHDAMLSGQGGSDFLIPKVDLSQVLPLAAEKWLLSRGCDIRLGERVEDLASLGVRDHTDPHSPLIVLACDAVSAARLCASINPDWSQGCRSLDHYAIATTYVQCLDPHFTALKRPILSLDSDVGSVPDPLKPAQFVFDRSAIFNTQRTAQNGPPHNGALQERVLSFVCSYATLSNELTTERVLQQARDELGVEQLKVLGTITEKRATFGCYPDLIRPAMQVSSSVWACGDYVEGPYPATLEGAVMSGSHVALEMARTLITAPK